MKKGLEKAHWLSRGCTYGQYFGVVEAYRDAVRRLWHEAKSDDLIARHLKDIDALEQLLWTKFEDERRKLAK